MIFQFVSAALGRDAGLGKPSRWDSRCVRIFHLGQWPGPEHAPVEPAEGLRVHDLRHTSGTLATAAGGSLREVMHRWATPPRSQPCATGTCWPTRTLLALAS